MIIPIKYSGAKVILLCFSLVDPNSLKSVTKQWVPEIRHYCTDVPIVLVGTKSDHRDEPNPDDIVLPPISSDRGQLKANEIGASSYIECSSKTVYM